MIDSDTIIDWLESSIDTYNYYRDNPVRFKFHHNRFVDEIDNLHKTAKNDREYIKLYNRWLIKYTFLDIIKKCLDNEKENHNISQEVIIYLLREFKTLTRTQLVKFMYLVDRQYYLHYNEPLTNFTWEVSARGVRSSDLIALYYNMLEDEIITESFSDGHYIISLRNTEQRPSLNPDVIKVVEEVIDIIHENELLQSDRLLTFIYILPEVMISRFGAKIDFQAIK